MEGEYFETPTCNKCGECLEWESCHACFGKGKFDLHEEDAVDFAPEEEFEKCDECNGHGGYLICPACAK